MNRLLTVSIFTIVTLAYATAAKAQVARPSLSYICSNGSVYSVWVQSNKPSGYTNRGAWHELRAFCDRRASTYELCRRESSPQTWRCYNEFKTKGNVERLHGKYAVWPDKIRHSPSSSWFKMFAMPRKSDSVCQSAINSLGCTTKLTYKEQLKCVYDRSGLNNRAIGRNCYSHISSNLSKVAQRRVAGR